MQVVGSNWPKPHYTLLITGLCRFRVAQLLKEGPFPVAEVEQLDKLEQYTSPEEMSEAAGPEGELGELSQRFYQAAVQVGVTDNAGAASLTFSNIIYSISVSYKK